MPSSAGSTTWQWAPPARSRGRRAKRPACAPPTARSAGSRSRGRAEGRASPRRSAAYNGLRPWFANAQSGPERLQWKGSHLDVAVSPDGRFVITSMQEPTLHGWRLADRKDMRMSGYGARVRSLDWSVGGRWLATSGSTQLILWPFQGKDGPM